MLLFSRIYIYIKYLIPTIYLRSIIVFFTSLIKSQNTNLSVKNVHRFIRSQKWFAVDGDNTLRLDYDLNYDSIVFDLGGYRGEWSDKIYNIFKCNIYIFEVHPEYAESIQLKFDNFKKIRVYNFGLSHQNSISTLSVSGDASSIFLNYEFGIKIQLKEFKTFLYEQNISHIDLIKINIEGGEYDLLEHIIYSGLINEIRIENIQIQFHDFIPNWQKRMKNIQNKLSETHKLTYQHALIWENWSLVSE